MVLIMDTHVKEPSTEVYSVAPLGVYEPTSPEDQLASLDHYAKTAPELIPKYKAAFPVSLRYFDYKIVPDAFSTSVALGISPLVKTLGVDVSPVSKTSATWVRCKEPLQSHVEHCSALAYAAAMLSTLFLLMP